MDLEQLARLKKRLTDTSDYDEVMRDFVGGLGIDPGFMARGTPVIEVILTQIVEDTARRFIGLTRPIEPQLFSHVEAAQFLHGGFHFGLHMAAVMYFSDIALGALSLTPVRGRAMTHFVRFRACKMTRQSDPSRN